MLDIISGTILIGVGMNFKYLDSYIHYGFKEIVLDSDAVLNDGEEEEYPLGIPLDVDDLVIDGNGHTIDACGKTEIFHSTGKNIEIKNITLKNGQGKYSGGAIYNEGGELTIADSTITKSKSAEGGAIFNHYGKLTIIRTTITENTAEYGGAISNNEGELIIIESALNGNSTELSGGAIYNLRSKISITESQFNGNSAEFDGGAIYNLVGDMNIAQSEFSENLTHRGEIIYHKSGNFKVFNSAFSNNESPTSTIRNLDQFQVHYTDFSANHCQNVIVNDGDLANLSVLYGEFKDNDIGESVILNMGKSCTIKKTIFEKNHSDNIININALTLIDPKIKDEGKTILNQNYVLIKKSHADLENKIYGEGIVENERKFKFEKFDFEYLDKAIHESATKEICLEENISFGAYETDYYEGGVELDIDNMVIDGKGHVIDAQRKARIFYCTGKNITLKNIRFKNGHSYKNYDNPFNSWGGAIKINGNASLNLENCSLINNSSEENGGAIYNHGKLSITESTLQENNTQAKDGKGGGIYNAGTLIIRESELRENNTQSEFDGGGAIHNEGMLSITDSTLHKNTAQGEYGKGGAIQNEGELNITRSLLSENTSNTGGAIVNGSGILTLTDSKIRGNTARSGYGGAISNGSGISTIKETALIHNASKREGGAVINWDGKLTITESMICQNSSQDKGGAIYNIEGEITITKSQLSRNSAQDKGGAICTSHGRITIIESELCENTVHDHDAEPGDPGKLFIDEDPWESSQGSGGAIYNGVSWVKISESELDENTAQGNGGGIYISRGTAEIENSIFSKNSSKQEGESIFAINGSFKLKNCTFNDKRAPDNFYKNENI